MSPLDGPSERCPGEGRPYTGDLADSCPACGVTWQALGMPAPAAETLVPWHARRDR